MKSLRLENSNLLTEAKIVFQGKGKEFNRMLVDTSSTETVLDLKRVKELGIELTNKSAYKLDNVSISVGPLKIKDFTIKVTDLQDELDGILGLDFLKRVGAKINLESMTLSGSRVN